MKPIAKTVSSDAKIPNEMMSEMGSLDLVKNEKVFGNLGEKRFC